MTSNYVRPSKDIRDAGEHRDCCCICGKGLMVPRQWWCAECGRERGITSYAKAPEWVRFLVKDEEKRRRNFSRDDDGGLVSLDEMVDQEEADDEGGEPWPEALTVNGPDWPRHGG